VKVNLLDQFLLEAFVNQMKQSVCGTSRMAGNHRSISTVAPLAIAIVALLTAVPAIAQNYAANNIYTIVGGGMVSSTPLSADLPGPTAAVKDASGNIYIAAPTSSNVFKLSGGVFTVYAGQGFGGYGGDGSVAGNSSVVLGNPAGIAFDSSGNMFIADYGESRIRRVDAVTGKFSTYAGTGTKCAHGPNTCGDGGLATAALLNLPEALAFDSSNNLYIADANDNRIRRVDAVTGIITTYAGTLQTNGNSEENFCLNPNTACGDGGPATSAFLNFPEGIAFDSAGNLYIGDTFDNRVRVVSPSGTITAFAGNGGSCLSSVRPCGDGAAAANAQLHRPQGVFADGAGNVYIADTLDHRIRFVDAPTKTIITVVGTGAQGFAGDGSSGTKALLNSPVSVTVDSIGSILIADTGNQRIRSVAVGTISTIAGGGNGGDGGSATAATLAQPYGVTEDAAGNLYIVDQFNNRVRKVTNPTGSNPTITTVAGNGNLGYGGDGGSALNATLNQPSNAVIDSAGNLYIADTQNFVIRRVDGSTGNITTYAGVAGQTCFPTTSTCGDGGPATSAFFSFPLGLALDASNNLYIADWYGFKVRMVNASTGTISTVAGTGREGHSGDGGSATAANLDHPASLVLDSAGVLYISDQYSMKIRSVSGGIINTYALNGVAGLKGIGGPAVNASMWNPLALAIDPTNNIFVSGGNDSVVMQIDAATKTWLNTAGNTQKATVGGFSGDGGLATQARLANLGAAVDGHGHLFIGDGGNNRIRYVPMTSVGTASPSSLNFGTWALGTTSTAMNVTLTASGSLDLSNISVAITGANAFDFAQTNNCPATMVIKANCTISVTFTPSGYARRTATLVVNDSSATSPHNVTLNGNGPDFTIAAAPNTLTIPRGQNGSSTITLSPLGQFNQKINLSCAGAPGGTTCVLNPTSVTLDGVHSGTSSATITVGNTTAPGTYTLTVSGSFTPLRHPATITLTVQ
jgi:trimeric autotransporter adhesin